MARQLILQHLGKFSGINLNRAPHDEVDLSQYDSLLNMEFSQNGGVRGRRGFSLLSDASHFMKISSLYRPDYTGALASLSELVGVGVTCFKLEKSTVLFAGVGYTYTVLLDTATERFRFVLYNSGVAVTLTNTYSSETAAYLDLGTGLEHFEAPNASRTGVITIKDVAEAVATATGTAVTVIGARVNGTQTNSTINVDSGHGLSAGQVISINRKNSTPEVVLITATAATTLTFDKSVTVDDNMVIGPAAAPAIMLGVTPFRGPMNSTPVSFASTLYYHYWQPYLSCFDSGDIGNRPFSYPAGNLNSLAAYRPTHVEAADSSLYIFTQSKGPWTSGRKENTPNPIGDLDYARGFPCKFDGQRVYRSGIPPCYYGGTVADSGSGGNPDGTYKYSIRFGFRDKNGIYRTGNPSHFYRELSVTVVTNQVTVTVFSPRLNFRSDELAVLQATAGPTLTLNCVTGHGIRVGDVVSLGGPGTVTAQLITKRTVTAIAATTVTVDGSNISGIANNDLLGVDRNDGFNLTGITVALAGCTNANVIPHNGPSFAMVVGDPAYFYDRRTANYVERTITAAAAGSITVDGAPVTLVSGDKVSAGFRAEIFRTKASGNIFYRVATIPVVGISGGTFGTFSFIDNLADTSLLEEMDVPEEGYEHDLPPKARFGASHQGVMVYGGIPGAENTLRHSSAEDIEYCPEATHFIDFPPNSIGGITGIISDSESRLAVFTRRSYYDVSGDFPGLSYQVRAVRDKEGGTLSHGALAKIDGVGIAVHDFGVLAFRDGQVVAELGDEVSPLINNSQRLYGYLTSIFVDPENDRCLLYLPTSSTTGDYLLLHYSGGNLAWLDQAYEDDLGPNSGGDLVYDNDDVAYDTGISNLEIVPSRVFVSRSVQGDRTRLGVAFKQFTRVPSNVDALRLYADNHNPIRNRIKIPHLHLDTPSRDKEYIEFKVFSAKSAYEEETFPHTWSLTSYKDLQTTTSDSSNSLDLSSNTTLEAACNLKANSAKSLAIWLENFTHFTCPYLTGWQLKLADSYADNQLKK